MCVKTMAYEWDTIEYPSNVFDKIIIWRREWRKQTKSISKENSTFLLTQDPLNDRSEHFYFFMEKIFRLAIFIRQILF